MDQFCICGTQPGYPHPESCPYPLFNAPPDSEPELKWLSAARRLEIAAWLQQEGAIVIRVKDLGAASAVLEALDSPTFQQEPRLRSTLLSVLASGQGSKLHRRALGLGEGS